MVESGSIKLISRAKCRNKLNNYKKTGKLKKKHTIPV
jgi:hypothetical protein